MSIRMRLAVVVVLLSFPASAAAQQLYKEWMSYCGVSVCMNVRIWSLENGFLIGLQNLSGGWAGDPTALIPDVRVYGLADLPFDLATSDPYHIASATGPLVGDPTVQPEWLFPSPFQQSDLWMETNGYPIDIPYQESVISSSCGERDGILHAPGAPGVFVTSRFSTAGGCDDTGLINPTTNDGWVNFQIAADPTLDPAAFAFRDLTNAQVQVTAVTYEPGTSTRSGTEVCDTGTAGCAMVTPEPFTIVLLGSGLLALAGVVAWRQS